MTTEQIVLLLLLGLVVLGILWMAWRAFRASRYRLAGRVALVTGGSRGLGLVLARELVAHGARVAICARDADTLARAEADLRSRGGEVLAVPCDVGDEAQVAELVFQVEARFGAIDILINNAGIIQVGPFELMTRADFEEALRANLWGALNTCLAVLPSMRQRGAGRIVNISSIGGKVSIPHLLPYSVSKFALVGFSEGLRAEVGKDGIRVTTVCPGLMRTGSPRNAQFKGKHRAEYTWFAVSDSLPLLTMSAERAARHIVAALRRGEAEVVLSLPAKVLATMHDLMPETTTAVLGVVNRMLPGPGGIGTASRPGHDSETAYAPSVLTTLTERAARRNNEMAPEEQTHR